MTAISTDLGTIYRDAPTQRVYTREKLGDSWSLREYLYCDNVTTAAAPAVSRAELSWRMGYGMNPGEMTNSTWEPLDIAGHQVKIEIDQPGGAAASEWYGIVTADSRDLLGARATLSPDNPSTTERIENGWQTFGVMGLGEWYLDTTKVFTSKILDRVDPIGRGMTFNEGSGQVSHLQDARRVNRSKNTGLRGTYEFLDKYTTTNAGQRWTTEDIVDYLFEWNGPDPDIFPAVSIGWASDSVKPDWGEPVIHTHGRTLKSILDELFDRRRLLSYVVSWDDDASEIVVKGFTFADANVDLGDGKQLTANENPRTFDFDAAFDVRAATLRKVGNHKAAQVRVHGGRRRSVCTLSFDDSNLVGAWGAEQTEYMDGGSNAADYSSLDTAEKQRRDRIARSAPHLRDVFSAYNVWATTADGVEVLKTGNGQASTLYHANPRLDSAGEVVEEPAAYTPDSARLLRRLPMPTRRDYANWDGVSPETLEDTTGSFRTMEDFIAPIVFAKLPQSNNDATDRWCLGDQMADTSIESMVGEQQSWSLSLSMLETVPGLRVQVVGGPQHMITVAGPFQPHDIQGTLPYADDLMHTVAVEWANSVMVAYPQDVDPLAAGAARVIDIFDDNHRLDYIVPTTIVGIDDEGQLQECAGGFIRDDRPQMETVARVAFEWYSRTRQALTLRIAQATELASVGDLVTTIGAGATEQTVNTPITQITVNLGFRGTPVEATTTFSTDFAELDYNSLRQT